jgi:hypothetical protein
MRALDVRAVGSLHHARNDLAHLWADAAKFERLAVVQTAGVAAVGGRSHAAMLPPNQVIGTSEPL